MAFGQMISKMSNPAIAPCCVLGKARPTMQNTAMDVAEASNKFSFHYGDRLIIKSTSGCRSVMDRHFSKVEVKRENSL